MGEIKFALSSASLVYALGNRKKIRIAKKKGFDGVELLLTRRALNQLEKDTDLDDILSFHQPFREGKADLFDRIVFLDLNPFPSPWSYRNYFRLSSGLDIPIVVHVNDSHFSRLEPALKELRETDVMLEFNTYQISFESIQPQDFLEIAKKTNSEICFDVGYAKQAGWDIINAFKILKERVKIIHLYDLRKEDPKWTLDKNLTVGKGILPLSSFLQEVKKLDWSGQITFELMPEPFANHKASLEFVKSILS